MKIIVSALQRTVCTAESLISSSPPLSSQTKLAGEAQAKYERELMLHAADVEALQELKKRGQQEAAQKRQLEEQLNKTSSLLRDKTAALSTLEKQLKVGGAARRAEQDRGDRPRFKNV